jgi:hypothetical protein
MDRNAERRTGEGGEACVRSEQQSDCHENGAPHKLPELENEWFEAHVLLRVKQSVKQFAEVLLLARPEAGLCAPI